MDNRTQCFAFIFFAFSLFGHLFGQENYRDILQSTLDSIIDPYERSTGADFGPGLAFSFKSPYHGVMLSSGSLYSGQINSIPYEKGDSVSLVKVGILGRPFAYAAFRSQKELAILGEKDINELVRLQDSVKFWDQFEKIKKVKTREFAQYWLILDCQDEYDKYEKLERAFINFGSNSLSVRIKKVEDKFFLEFDLSGSYGNVFRGLGCAEDDNAFVEFTFADGSTLKKTNLDQSSCQILLIEISEEIARFENAIMELKLSMSKGEKNLVFDNELAQNHINLKLDCLIK